MERKNVKLFVASLMFNDRNVKVIRKKFEHFWSIWLTVQWFYISPQKMSLTWEMNLWNSFEWIIWITRYRIDSAHSVLMNRKCALRTFQIYELFENLIMEFNQSMDRVFINELMPEWGYKSASVVLFLIGVFGIIFNFCAIVIMSTNRKVKSSIKYSIQRFKFLSGKNLLIFFLPKSPGIISI